MNLWCLLSVKYYIMTKCMVKRLEKKHVLFDTFNRLNIYMVWYLTVVLLNTGLLRMFHKITDIDGEKVTRILFCGPHFAASHNYTREYVRSYPFIKVITFYLRVLIVVSLVFICLNNWGKNSKIIHKCLNFPHVILVSQYRLEKV